MDRNKAPCLRPQSQESSLYILSVCRICVEKLDGNSNQKSPFAWNVPGKRNFNLRDIPFLTFNRIIGILLYHLSCQASTMLLNEIWGLLSNGKDHSIKLLTESIHTNGKRLTTVLFHFHKQRKRSSIIHLSHGSIYSFTSTHAHRYLWDRPLRYPQFGSLLVLKCLSYSKKPQMHLEAM